MCVSNPKEEFPAKGGEKWFIRNKEFTVGTTHQKYFETNGDSSTLYLSMRDADGKCFVITHKAFMEKASRETPIKEVFITPRQILAGLPCEEGIVALGAVLGVSSLENSAWKVVYFLENRGLMDKTFKVSELYAKRVTRQFMVPDSWLNFLAKLLNLIPAMKTGPDRETLKRLLGIKE